MRIFDRFRFRPTDRLTSYPGPSTLRGPAEFDRGLDLPTVMDSSTGPQSGTTTREAAKAGTHLTASLAAALHISAAARPSSG